MTDVGICPHSTILRSDSVTIVGMSKKRKVPDLPSFAKDEESLEVRSAQAIFEQFLQKYPEQLGTILLRCPPKTRSIAIESLPLKDVVSAKIPISKMMEHTKLEMMDEFTVLKLEQGESTDELEYFTVRAASIDDRICGVLSLWLEDFYKNHPDEEARTGCVERDGSATLNVCYDMECLRDFIGQYVEDSFEMKGAIEKEEEDISDSDLENDADEEIEAVTQLIREFLEDGAGPPDFGNSDKIRLYQPVPKITIRYFAE